MRRTILLLALVASLATGVALAQSFSSVEERMTAAEFKAAGLEKLDEQELAALNAWMAKELGEAAPAPAADTRGLVIPDTRGPIVSTIPGAFKGWDRKGQRFTLANGQVWEVIDVAARLSVNLENPTVSISPGALGGWHMKVQGYNARVGVRRVR